MDLLRTSNANWDNKKHKSLADYVADVAKAYIWSKGSSGVAWAAKSQQQSVNATESRTLKAVSRSLRCDMMSRNAFRLA